MSTIQWNAYRTKLKNTGIKMTRRQQSAEYKNIKSEKISPSYGRRADHEDRVDGLTMKIAWTPLSKKRKKPVLRSNRLYFPSKTFMTS